MSAEAKDDAAPPKKSKKLLIIILAAVLLAGGGGGAFFYMKKNAAHGEEDTHAAEEAQRKKDMKSKVFVNLEPFTINLAGDEDRFAQVAVVLEVANNEMGEEIKALMPAVRNRVLLLLSGKEPRDLLTTEGKELLAVEIAVQTLGAIGREDEAYGSKAKKKKKKKRDEDEGDDEEDEDAPRKKKKGRVVDQESIPVRVHFAQFIVQ